jgi:hypothetical protein
MFRFRERNRAVHPMERRERTARRRGERGETTRRSREVSNKRSEIKRERLMTNNI